MNNFLDNTLPKIGHFLLSCYVAFWVVSVPLICMSDLRTLWGNERIQGSILDFIYLCTLGVGGLFYLMHCQSEQRRALKVEIEALKAQQAQRGESKGY